MYRLAIAVVVSFSYNTKQNTEPPKFPRLEQSWAAWPLDCGYSRRGIIGGSVLQL